METSTRRQSTLPKSGPSWAIHQSLTLPPEDIVRTSHSLKLSNALASAVQLLGPHRQVLLPLRPQVPSQRQLLHQLHHHHHLHRTNLHKLARSASCRTVQTFTKLPAKRARAVSRLINGLASSCMPFPFPKALAWFCDASEIQL